MTDLRLLLQMGYCRHSMTASRGNIDQLSVKYVLVKQVLLHAKAMQTNMHGIL